MMMSGARGKGEGGGERRWSVAQPIPNGGYRARPFVSGDAGAEDARRLRWEEKKYQTLFRAVFSAQAGRAAGAQEGGAGAAARRSPPPFVPSTSVPAQQRLYVRTIEGAHPSPSPPH